MSQLHTSAAPHINSGATTRNVMRDVAIALLPATVVAVILFGLQALLIVLVSVASAIASEYLFNAVCKKKQTVFDFSAIVTGLILALNYSTKVPLWLCALGSAFAIIVVKCLFGGLGKNLVNPAAAARVFLLISFAAIVGSGAFPSIGNNEVTTLKEDGTVEVLQEDVSFFDTAFGKTDTIVVTEYYEDENGVLKASATPLGEAGTTNAPSTKDLVLGKIGGTIGEVCVLALLLGYAYLVLRGVIKWYVPVAFVGTVFGLFLIRDGFNIALYQVLAGGLLFGAIFMATDYVTTPLSNLGKVVFCIGCGLITFAFRIGFVGGYPEGVSISIVFMNLLTPMIEKWTNPRTLGGVK